MKVPVLLSMLKSVLLTVVFAASIPYGGSRSLDSVQKLLLNHEAELESELKAIETVVEEIAKSCGSREGS